MIRGYMAASLDGYVADRHGGVDWLRPFEAHDLGFDAFLAEIATVVLGRVTYDQIVGFGGPWPYSRKRAVVVTSRPIAHSQASVERLSGPLTDLVASLRESGAGDTWVVGGAALQRAFLDLGALDRLELFVIPVLLGQGIAMFPPSADRHALTLRSAAMMAGGIARLDYAVAPPQPRPVADRLPQSLGLSGI